MKKMPIYMVKKFDDMFNRFGRIPACDGRTDGQTSCDGVVRAMHGIARQKNQQMFLLTARFGEKNVLCGEKHWFYKP